jgi:hypothetical protein
MPDMKKETRLLNIGPRSAKISMSKPVESFSVIMLVPNAESAELLKGYIKAETSINIKNQTINTPFHDLKALKIPVVRELNILILT